jgi:hypothetical protein
MNVKIGDYVTASIGLNKAWVTYTKSEEGEENYYRDVYKNDSIIYMEGEQCRIESINNETVTLSNENNDAQNIFTISHSQFVEDFTKSCI